MDKAKADKVPRWGGWVRQNNGAWSGVGRVDGRVLFFAWVPTSEKDKLGFVFCFRCFVWGSYIDTYSNGCRTTFCHATSSHGNRPLRYDGKRVIFEQP